MRLAVELTTLAATAPRPGGSAVTKVIMCETTKRDVATPAQMRRRISIAETFLFPFSLVQTDDPQNPLDPPDPNPYSNFFHFMGGLKNL